MKKIIIVLFVIAGFLFVGCDTDPVKGGTYHSVDTVSENSWRSDTKRYQVIRTQAILNEVFEDNTFDVDFTAYTVIAVSLGTTPLEHKVEAVEALEKEDYMQITTESSMPAENCDIDEGYIYPSHIVKIPKSSKNVIFSETYRINNCNGLSDYEFKCNDESSGDSVSYTTLKSGSYYFESSEENKQIQIFESSNEDLKDLYEKLANEDIPSDINGTILYINSGTNKAHDKFNISINGIKKVDIHLKVNIKTTAPGETCESTSSKTNLFQFINIPSKDYNVTDIVVCESYEVIECE